MQDFASVDDPTARNPDARPRRRSGWVWRAALALVRCRCLRSRGRLGRWTRPFGAAAAELRDTELSAAAFLDSIGVVVHLNYVDTAYGRQGEVLGRLRELGVRHIREAMPTPPVGPLADGLRAARRGRDPRDARHGRPERRSRRGRQRTRCARWATRSRPSRAPTSWTTAGIPAGPTKLRAYMPALRAAVESRRRGLPLVGPQLHQPGESQAGARPAGAAQRTPLPGRQATRAGHRGGARRVRGQRGRRGMVFTETGYHNALADTDEQPPTTRRWPPSTCRGSTRPPSGRGYEGRSSTSCSTRSPIRG